MTEAKHAETPEPSVTEDQLVENGFEVVASTFTKEAPWKDREANVLDDSLSYADSPAAVVSERAQLLRDAEELIDGDRNTSYGHPTQNFTNIAALWNVQFGHMLRDGHQFTPSHVAQAMSHVKLARLVASNKRDHYVDLAGYAACGWEAEPGTP